MATANSPLPAELTVLLKKHRSLTLLPCGVKLRCALTGHEMKACVAAVAPYVGGARYGKARKWYSRSFESYLTPELLPLADSWLRPHKDSDKLLFCALTRRAVNRIPEKVVRHLLSPRFTHFLALHSAGKSLPTEDGKEEEEEEEEEEAADEEGGIDEEVKGGGAKPSAGAARGSGGGGGGDDGSDDDNEEDLDAGWRAMEEAAATAKEEAVEAAAAVAVAAGAGGKGKRRFAAVAGAAGAPTGGASAAKKKK